MRANMKQKILGFNDLAPRGIRFSRVHVSRLEKEGKFPQHLNLAPQSIGWLEEEIDAWIAARAAERCKGNRVDPVLNSANLKMPSCSLTRPMIRSTGDATRK
jgi:prophage regulatory protein